MSSINIPLENWLAEIADNKVKSMTPVKVKSVAILSEGFDYTQMTKMSEAQKLVCSELVIYLNNVLNTDTLLWPEGLREDFSNIALVKKENGEACFTIVIDKDELDEGTVFVPDTEGLVLIEFTLRNDIFVGVDSAGLMDMLLDPDLSKALFTGDAAVIAVRPNAPEVRLMYVDEDESDPSFSRFLLKGDYEPVLKTAIARYVNKVTNNSLSDELMEHLLHFCEITREDKTEFLMSFDLFGRVIFMGVDYVEGYNPNPQETEDEIS